MKRYSSILFLAASVAGCGNGSGGKVDLGGSGGDSGGGGMQDLTMVQGQPDLSMAGAPTGDPCAKATDCGGTKPNCIVKDMTGTAWPGGYCTSSCNPSKNDQQTGLEIARLGSCQTSVSGCHVRQARKMAAEPPARLSHTRFRQAVTFTNTLRLRIVGLAVAPNCENPACLRSQQEYRTWY